MRLEMLQQIGLGVKEMQQYGIGPVLFKETCSFRREMHFGDQIALDFKLLGLTPDLGRFAFRHEFYKGETFCARLEVIGAWIDIKARKLTLPSPEFAKNFQLLPKADDFSEEVKA
jgi:acyl-CoA thioester hydrolase